LFRGYGFRRRGFFHDSGDFSTADLLNQCHI
jgi:hypothetical protein